MRCSEQEKLQAGDSMMGAHDGRYVSDGDFSAEVSQQDFTALQEYIGESNY